MIDALDLATAQPLAASASGQGAAIAQPLSADARWNQWKAKGRVDNARFRRRLKMVVVDLAAVIAFGGAVWFALQF
jgi:hypothetical protein